LDKHQECAEHQYMSCPDAPSKPADFLGDHVVTTLNAPLPHL
jgi:hypothetical protein